MRTFIIFSIFLLFTLHATSLLDPDFGWHVTLGNYIQKSGIPYTDPFSYSMQSYPFIDHEWLSNIFIAQAYSTVGVYGLTIIFALIACIPFTLQLFLLPVSTFSIGLVIVEAATFFGFFGIRPQVITWALFSLLVIMLLKKNWWKKLRFFLPFLFLLWVNLHGGFAIGIFLFFLYVLFSPKKKVNILIFLLCVLATSINPYGVHIWYEVFNQVSDSHLRWHIQEWQPSIFMFDIPLWIFFTFSSQLIFLKKKHFSAFQLFTYVLLASMGIASIRHIPLLFLFSFPLVIRAFSLFSSTLAGKKIQLKRLKKVEKIFMVSAIGVAIFQAALFFYPFSSFIDYDQFYPKQASAYLHTHLPKGNILSLYEWGGYLLWKLPEKKVFIDGRMPSWRWKSPSPWESNYALVEYTDVFNGKRSLKEFEEKYRIDTILLPQKKYLNKNFKSKNSFDIHTAVIRSGMTKIYSDSLSVIYQKE